MPIAIAAAVAIGGLYLRVEHLNRDSLWHDEAYSAQEARLPPAAIVEQAAAHDNNPPLYYLLLHYWTRLYGSDGETALRGLSVAFGVLGIAAIFLAAHQLGGRVVAIWSSALLAASLFHVEYSREARMYTLLFVTSTMSMYTFLRLGGGSGRTRHAAWIASTLALLMSHTVGMFVWAAEHVCWLWLRWRNDRGAAGIVALPLGRWLAVNAGVAAAALPWAVETYYQHQRLDGVFWVHPPYLREPIDVVLQFVGTTPVFGGAVLAGLIGALTVTAARRRAAGVPPCTSINTTSVAVLLIWGAMPVFAPWIWSYIDVPILIPRIAIAALAPLLIGLAAAVVAIRPRAVSVGVGSALVLAFALQSWNYTHRLTKEDWRGVAALVQNEARAGDLLLLHEGTRRIGLEYYLRHPVAEIAGFPDHRFRAGETVIPSELDTLRARVARYRRVWLITAHSHDPRGLIVHTLGEQFRQERRRTFRQIEVILFSRRERPEPVAAR